MSKKKSVLLFFGIAGMLGGLITANIHGAPKIIAIILFSLGSGLIAVVFAKRGGFAIRDEMVIRIESLSGNYTTFVTLYFIFVLSIVNYFHPLKLSVDSLLIIMMMFLSLTYLIIRYCLMKWGKTE